MKRKGFGSQEGEPGGKKKTQERGGKRELGPSSFGGGEEEQEPSSGLFAGMSAKEVEEITKQAEELLKSGSGTEGEKTPKPAKIPQKLKQRIDGIQKGGVKTSDIAMKKTAGIPPQKEDVAPPVPPPAPTGPEPKIEIEKPQEPSREDLLAEEELKDFDNQLRDMNLEELRLQKEKLSQLGSDIPDAPSYVPVVKEKIRVVDEEIEIRKFLGEENEPPLPPAPSTEPPLPGPRPHVEEEPEKDKEAEIQAEIEKLSDELKIFFERISENEKEVKALGEDADALQKEKKGQEAFKKREKIDKTQRDTKWAKELIEYDKKRIEWLKEGLVLIRKEKDLKEDQEVLGRLVARRIEIEGRLKDVNIDEVEKQALGLELTGIAEQIPVKQALIAAMQLEMDRLKGVAVAEPTRPGEPKSPEDKQESGPITIEDVKNRVTGTKEREHRLLKERCPESFIARAKRWLNETHTGRYLKIAGKVIGGTLLAMNIGVLTGGSGLILAPMLYSLGTKEAIDGVIDLFQYTAMGGRSSRSKINSMRREFSSLYKEYGEGWQQFQDPNIERMKELVGKINEEEKAFTARDIKQKKFRAIASAVGTVGVGVMAGIPFGVQDFDKNGVYHAVRLTDHGFQFLYNTGEQMAQTVNHTILGGMATHTLANVVNPQIAYGTAAAVAGMAVRVASQWRGQKPSEIKVVEEIQGGSIERPVDGIHAPPDKGPSAEKGGESEKDDILREKFGVEPDKMSPHDRDVYYTERVVAYQNILKEKGEDSLTTLINKVYDGAKSILGRVGITNLELTGEKRILGDIARLYQLSKLDSNIPDVFQSGEQQENLAKAMVGLEIYGKFFHSSADLISSSIYDRLRENPRAMELLHTIQNEFSYDNAVELGSFVIGINL